MKEIPLTNSSEMVLIDDEDFDRISSTSAGWYIVIRHKNTKIIQTKINYKSISLGTFILGKEDGFYVDHIDRNPLNNQKYNLRYATNAENMANREKQTNNKSGYKGISWDKSRGYWKAQLRVNGINVLNKRFTNIESAIEEYNSAAKKNLGEFAVLNIVNQ